MLQHWLGDADFNGVRDDGIAKLPAEEQQAWRQLWADVADTLKKAGEKPTPEPNPRKYP